jgi:hypothetical protein
LPVQAPKAPAIAPPRQRTESFMLPND